MATDETEKGELRSFALVLQSLDEGTVHGDCTDRLQELNTQLMKYAEDFGKAKGTLKLTLKMTVERGGTAEILADIETKAPRASRAKSILWLNKKNGRLTTANPRQLELGVRSVPNAPVVGEKKN